MVKRNTGFLAQAMRFAAALALCAAAPASGVEVSAANGPAVAVVNDVPIPRARLERSLAQARAAGRADSPALQAQLRQELIAEELVFQEALRRRLDQTEEFRVAMENAQRRALAAFVLASVRPEPVSDADVQRAYDKSASGRLPQDVRLRAIVVDDEASMKTVRSALARGAVFETLAQEHSRAPSAARGGDLGWTNLKQPDAEGAGGGLPTAVAAEVRKLAKGGFTPAVRDGSGRWWLVKLDATRAAQLAPFERLSAQIRRLLERDAAERARQRFLAELRQAARVTE